MFDELENDGRLRPHKARNKIVEVSTGRPVVHADRAGRRGLGQRLKLRIGFRTLAGEAGGETGNRAASFGPGLGVLVKERSYGRAKARQPNMRHANLGLVALWGTL